jgi:hypothetical protein
MHNSRVLRHMGRLWVCVPAWYRRHSAMLPGCKLKKACNTKKSHSSNQFRIKSRIYCIEKGYGLQCVEAVTAAGNDDDGDCATGQYRPVTALSEQHMSEFSYSAGEPLCEGLLNWQCIHVCSKSYNWLTLPNCRCQARLCDRIPVQTRVTCN